MTQTSPVGSVWPGVGVATIVYRDGKILLGQRGAQSAHARGVWSMPGGKLDFGESLEDCARRETREEAGLEVEAPRFVALTNDIFAGEERHFITIFMLASSSVGEPQVLEPGKMEEWAWFAWDELPHPLMLPIENLLKQGFDLEYAVRQLVLQPA